jgi:hypothetical protein
MKRYFAAALLLACSSIANADDGILSRFSNNERTAPTEILIINGQAYTAPAGTAARIQQQQEQPQGAVDSRTGQYYPSTGTGLINPSNGMVYPDVGAGYINPKNGQFIPK